MKTFRVALGVVCLFIALVSAAKPAHVQLFLDNIKDVKSNERGTDEIYLSITAKYSNGKFKSYTMPGGRPPVIDGAEAGFPAGPPEAPQLYWLSRALENVKNVSLWSEDLEAGQAVQLTVSVIEHDMPPWNLDDMIGSIKINIGNKNGKIAADWALISSEPKQASGKFPTKKSEGFDIGGGKGLYHITLTVK